MAYFDSIDLSYPYDILIPTQDVSAVQGMNHRRDPGCSQEFPHCILIITLTPPPAKKPLLSVPIVNCIRRFNKPKSSTINL